jgi:CRP-like cAMP-binding protein
MLLDGVEIFTSLTADQRVQLAMASRPLLFAAGQAIVREGENGATMFVLKSGEASVTLAKTEGELARLGAGAFFGEMSLLTGDPRSATVTAITDCELIEIGAEAFRNLVLADAAIVDHVTAAVAKRRAELEQHRTNRSIDQLPSEAPQTLVARVRRFLRL